MRAPPAIHSAPRTAATHAAAVRPQSGAPSLHVAPGALQAPPDAVACLQYLTRRLTPDYASFQSTALNARVAVLPGWVGGGFRTIRINGNAGAGPVGDLGE